ncbi:MAG: tRNA threonylcarbamoyladenosine dehydratase [Clostridia bacterium]|nr:tRNA threonylcarbamoyladenosine dehydratase [Clostridia bacterium]
MPVKDSRTALLLGEEGVNALKKARVAVFGIGGVGGFACEALARAGVGSLLLVDDDTVSESNLNRQLIALRSTIGQPKVSVMAARIADIDPSITVETRQCFFDETTAGSFDFSAFDYVIDAIDTVSAKVELICRAKAAGIPIVSCMGAGNKLDPTKFVVTDLAKTDTCPLARVLRQRLRKQGIAHLQVVYSTEPPLTPLETIEDGGRRQLPGSVSFVPSAAGLVAAGAVIRALCGKE